jgi:transporter family-2 protein
MSTPISGATMLPLAVALFAGAVVPFQAASNAALGRSLGHPLWATLASLAVSIAVVIPLVLSMRAPAPQLSVALAGPWWLWVGGLAGAAYITAALLLTPRLGVASFMVCVIAGQVIASVVIDHFGMMGVPAKPATLGRIGGVLLIVIGMAVIQWSARVPTE